MASRFDVVRDPRTGVVHFACDRTAPVYRGNGDIDYEEHFVSLCDVWVPEGWTLLPEAAPVTCLMCLHEEAQMVAVRFVFARAVAGRMSSSRGGS